MTSPLILLDHAGTRAKLRTHRVPFFSGIPQSCGPTFKRAGFTKGFLGSNVVVNMPHGSDAARKNGLMRKGTFVRARNIAR
jgi:hypothetical protein